MEGSSDDFSQRVDVDELIEAKADLADKEEEEEEEGDERPFYSGNDNNDIPPETKKKKQPTEDGIIRESKISSSSADAGPPSTPTTTSIDSSSNTGTVSVATQILSMSTTTNKCDEKDALNSKLPPPQSAQATSSAAAANAKKSPSKTIISSPSATAMAAVSTGKDPSPTKEVPVATYSERLDARKATYLSYYSDDDNKDDNDDIEAANNTTAHQPSCTSGTTGIGERPGAYMGLPGSNYERIASLRVGLNPAEQPPRQQEQQRTQSSLESLDEAQPQPSPDLDTGQVSTTSNMPRQLSMIRPISGTTSGRYSVPKLSAVRVDEDELERELALNIRKEITNNAAQAQVVDLQQETEQMEAKIQRKYIGLILMILIVLAIVLIVVLTKHDNNDHLDIINGVNNMTGTIKGPAKPSTLQSIRNKGYLSCGLTKRDKNAKIDPDYLLMVGGFVADLCRAIAAAVLDGEPDADIHVISDESERWDSLQNGTLDVVITGLPSSTGSLYFDLDPDVPVTFSTPMFYDGVGVGGFPAFVENCAKEGGFRSIQECNAVRVCATMGSMAFDILVDILHPNQIIEVLSLQELYNRFADGCCNMIATDWTDERAEISVRRGGGYRGPYKVGESLYTKQPYAVATRRVRKGYQQQPHYDEDERRLNNIPREEDPQVFSEFVNWVLQSLIVAEQRNITQNTADFMPATEVFGEGYQHVFRHAVAAVGNYGEMYDRNVGHVIPREGMNVVSDGSTGLHYHRSIGDVGEYGDAVEHGTLLAIKERGKLMCGIPNRDADQSVEDPLSSRLKAGPAGIHEAMGVSQIDVEYCKALASSVFQGLSIPSPASQSCMVSDEENADTMLSDGRIEFVPLSGTPEGYQLLNDGNIDVIAGFRMTLESDVREKTTGKGYSFSQPYFYGPVSDEEEIAENNRCLVTRQDDTEWSDFVHLVVMSIFFAEERGIAQQRANDMPPVNLFGPSFKRMMKDSVFGVGHYGEMHGRLDQTRSGPNGLNLGSTPQLFAMPGIV